MRKIVRIAAITLAVLLLAAVALPFLIDVNVFRPRLEAALGQALGRDLKLGSLKLTILSGAVAATDLEIAEDPAYGAAPFVRARSVRIGVDLWPLILSRKLNVTGITIEKPEIRLVEGGSGNWNFSSLGNSAAPKPKSAEPTAGSPLDLSVKLVKIKEGRISLSEKGGHGKPRALDAVDLELRDFSGASEFPFAFSGRVESGGEIKLEGKAGPLVSENVVASPLSLTLKIRNLDLAGSNKTLGGLISLDGSLQSNGRTAQVKGGLKAEKLKLANNATPAPRAVALEFSLDHNLKTGAGHLRQGDIHIGAARATLTGVYSERGTETIWRLNLSGPNMPVPELAAILPAMGIVLPAGSSLRGGTMSVKLSIEGPSAGLVTSGSVGLENTTLAGFDLGRKMAVIQTMAGLPGGPNTEIQTLRTDLRMSPEGIRADGIQMVVPAIGELAGAGAVSAERALDFKMTAKVHTSGMMAAMRDAPIPFLVGGTATDPVFRPDVRAIVSEKAKSTGTKAVQGLLDRFLGGKKN